MAFYLAYCGLTECVSGKDMSHCSERNCDQRSCFLVQGLLNILFVSGFLEVWNDI